MLNGVRFKDRLEVILQRVSDSGLTPVLDAERELDEGVDVVAKALPQPVQHKVPFELAKQCFLPFKPSDESTVRVFDRVNIRSDTACELRELGR